MKVICWPKSEGLAEDASAVKLAALDDPVPRETPERLTANGLPFPLLSTKRLPDRIDPGKLSAVGTNETFTMQVRPTSSVEGQ